MNYHKHDYYSNVYLADSVVSPEDYAKRAVELGQTIISSCNHGTAGAYRLCADLAAKYNLRWRYVAEAYFVKDRLAEDADGRRDRKNAHIILAAKTEKGIGDLNEVLSEANISGYYFRPRVDMELLLRLDPKDVFVTTACIGGVWTYGYSADKEAGTWSYNFEEPDKIVKQLAAHFGDSFMLEVQYHPSEKQKVVNWHILELYRTLGIPLIAGMDSHFIYPEEAELRNMRLEANHIVYDGEEEFFMDYPSEEEAYRRFEEQGVLSPAQIHEAMENTNIFLEFEDVVLDKSRKLPTIYPELTQEERNEKYRELVTEKWEEYKKGVPEERWPEYEAGIEYEVNTITSTNTSDYFLLDYEWIRRAKEMGGQLTKTGRGCFTESARIATLDGLKKISEVVPGDTVIDKGGHYKHVLGTFAYDIDEPLVEIQATANKMFGSYPTCTLDHKVLVALGNGCYKWIRAAELQIGDRLCVPKINVETSTDEVVDLSNYANRLALVDENYVYESHCDDKRAALFPWDQLSEKYHMSRAALMNFFSGRVLLGQPVKKAKQLYETKLQILKDFHCKTQEDLVLLYRQHISLPISRHFTKDTLFYEFLGMLYGDGWIAQKANHHLRCGIALNSDNEKNIYNRQIFETMAAKLGAPITERKSSEKKLIQLELKSSSFAKYLAAHYFVSSKGNHKQIPEEILRLDNEKSKAFLSGLMHTDGNQTDEYRKCFDNTSISLINAFRILCMKSGEMPPRLTIRKAWVDSRGYSCKTSYKLTIPIYLSSKGMFRKTSEDENYWLMPITGIKILPRQKTRVYDLHVEDSHSFLLNNMIVHNSAPSYFTNTLLGFSSIDRFALPITMYPDRFISADRLKSGSMPDADMNVSDQDLFGQAMEDVMGKWHCAPMVAFGTLKRLSAWKMYCRAANVPFEIANELSEKLKAYELDVKHADDDEKEFIDVLDYVPEQYHEYLKASEKYLGMVDSISPHPCAYLLCNNDIRREVGIFRINAKNGSKKVVYAAFIDGVTADAYGYLKNDDLQVLVVKLNADIYRRIGIPQPSVPELLKMTNGDAMTWDLYAKGLTLGLNQAEKEKSTEKVMRYKPRNISELSAFVAGIRPGFQSMAPKLFNREKFSYGIPALDQMIQTKEMPDSFILYQEQVMMIMQWAGFQPSESYAAIKAIAKKHPEKVLPMKERFLAGFRDRLIRDANVAEEEAMQTSAKVWKIIEDNTSYSFNSSHSVSVALDSLYTAWAKAHYPYETYVSLLSNYAEKKDKDRIAKAKEEMLRGFGIRIVPCKFRQDNRSYFVDKDAHTISDALTSVKGISATAAKTLYQMRNKQYASAVDLFYDLEVNTAINSAVIKTLIQMGYFEEFGSAGKLLKLYTEFRDGESRFAKTYVAKTQAKRLDALRQIEQELPECTIPMGEQMAFEVEYYGTPLTTYPEQAGCFAVLEVDDKYSPKIKMYNVAKGTTGVMKVRKALYKEKPLRPGDVMRLIGWKRRPAYQYIDGKQVAKDGVYDLWIQDYEIVKA